MQKSLLGIVIAFGTFVPFVASAQTRVGAGADAGLDAGVPTDAGTRSRRDAGTSPRSERVEEDARPEEERDDARERAREDDRDRDDDERDRDRDRDRERAERDRDGDRDRDRDRDERPRRERERRTAREDRASNGRSDRGGGGEEASRQGLFLEGGLYLTGGHGDARPWLRVGVGIPLIERLSLVIPFMFTHDSYSVGGFSADESVFRLVPGVRYDFPLYHGQGDLSVHGEGGLGVDLVHTNAEGFGSDNYGFGTFRAAAGVTYVAPFGLMATIQPAGMSLVFGHGDAFAYYEASLLLGYRFE